jgi:hypothetical protein
MPGLVREEGNGNGEVLPQRTDKGLAKISEKD